MISGFSLLIHLLSVFRFHNNNPTIYKTDLHFIIHKLVAHRQTVARHQIMMTERPFRTLQTEIIDLIKVMKGVYDDETCIYAYEIDMNKEDVNEKMKELVKKYYEKHGDKIYAKYERICRVKS